MKQTAQGLLPLNPDYKPLPEAPRPRKEKSSDPRKIFISDILTCIAPENSNADTT